MTVTDLCNTWLFSACLSVKDHTFKDYKNYVKYFNYYIGFVDVSCLTSDHVQMMFFRLVNDFNSKTAFHAYSIFRIVVNYGIEHDFLLKNVLKGVRVPKSDSFAPTFLGEAELKRLLLCAEDYGIYNAVLLAGCAGLRRGECLALSSSDIDTEHNAIRVTHSAEWKSGKRIITGLKSRRSNRVLLVSSRFIHSLFNHSDSDFFCDYSQSVLQRRFSSCLKDNGFAPMRFHDLRHTYASISLMKQVNIKALSERLGHSSVSLTLDTYAHLDISAQASFSSLFDDFIV